MKGAFGAISLLVGLLLGLSPRPVVDNSVVAISATGDERAAVYADLRARFGADEVLAVRIEAPDLPALAHAVEVVETRVSGFPPVERVLGPKKVYPDELAVLGDPDMLDAPTLERVKATLRGPLGRSLRLLELEPPSAVVLGFCRAGKPEMWRSAERELADLAAELAPRGAAILAAGGPLLHLALDREGARVEREGLPILGGVTVLLLLALTGSVRLVACVIAPVGLGVLGGEGAYGWLGLSTNLVVNVAKPLLFVLLLASGLHVALAFERRLGEGEDRVAAAWNAAAEKASGVALALLTTAIGFASLGLAEVIPIRRFGWLSAAGLLGGAPLLLFGLPALLARFGPRRPWRTGGRRRLEAGLLELLEIARRARVAVFALTALLFAGGLGAAFSLPPPTHAVEFFPAHHPARAAHEALERAGSSLMTVELVLRSAEPGALEAELSALDRFAAAAVELPRVRGRLDLPLLLRDAEFRMSGEDRLPAAPEMWLEDHPEAVRGFLEGHHHRVALLVETIAHEPLERLERALESLRAEQLPTWTLEVTGNLPVTLHSQTSLRTTLIVSLALTLVLMQVVLLLALRSVRLALVATIPNLVPVAVNLLLVAALGVPLDVGTAMTGAVALGIAVDDTLHFLVAWRGHGLEEAMRRTGRALVLSTVVIAAGFFALVPSEFLPTRHFALLTATAIVAALIADLVLLPLLLPPQR